MTKSHCHARESKKRPLQDPLALRSNITTNLFYAFYSIDYVGYDNALLSNKATIRKNIKTKLRFRRNAMFNNRTNHKQGNKIRSKPGPDWLLQLSPNPRASGVNTV